MMGFPPPFPGPGGAAPAGPPGPAGMLGAGPGLQAPPAGLLPPGAAPAPLNPYPGAGPPGGRPASPEEDIKTIKEPALEEVDALLRRDAVRGFRIDIESDSTVRADLSRNQANMSAFMQAAAAYWQTIGPLLAKFPSATEGALELFGAFARNFKIGKQAEDALDRLADEARKNSEQPPQPQPEHLKMIADAKLQSEELQLKERQRQDKKAADEQKHLHDMERLALDGRIAQAEADHRREDHRQRLIELNQRSSEFASKAMGDHNKTVFESLTHNADAERENAFNLQRMTNEERNARSREEADARRHAERQQTAQNSQEIARQKLILPPGFERK
jgi:hypothetical protein